MILSREPHPATTLVRPIEQQTRTLEGSPGYPSCSPPVSSPQPYS
jgi:hypothetical protein